MQTYFRLSFNNELGEIIGEWELFTNTRFLELCAVFASNEVAFTVEFKRQ